MTVVNRKQRRKNRKKIMKGNITRPRMVVFKSNSHLYVQVIDDEKSNTLTGYSSLDKEFKSKYSSITLQNLPFFVDKLISKMQDVHLNSIIFDKNGFSYSGITKKLAELLRAGGIVF